jgi:hypothetical protein
MIFEKMVSDMAYLFFRFKLSHQKDRADPNILTSLRSTRECHASKTSWVESRQVLDADRWIIRKSPYDYDYGTYGTKTPRTDMRHGRVGSVLSDPVYRGGETLAEPGVITEGIISEGVISEGVISEGVISDGVISEGIISEGVISGEPQRVLRTPMRAPLRSPLGSQGEIIIE